MEKLKLLILNNFIDTARKVMEDVEFKDLDELKNILCSQNFPMIIAD